MVAVLAPCLIQMLLLLQGHVTGEVVSIGSILIKFLPKSSCQKYSFLE